MRGTPPLSLLSFFCLSPVLPLVWHIIHPDSREVLQFSNGQEEVSSSYPPLALSSLFLFFCPSPVLPLPLSPIRTPERCYSSAMDRRRLAVCLSYPPLALSSLFLFSIFLPYFLYFDTSGIRTPERCYSSAMDRRRLVRLSLNPPSSSLFSLSFFYLSPVLPLLWHYHASGLQRGATVQ
jgi:hypothetical protein